MKVCKICKCEKCETSFGKNKYSKDKLNYECKGCRAAVEQARRISRGVEPKIKPKICEGGKQCLKCKELFSLEKFQKNSRGRFGRSSYCFECEKQYHKDLKSSNPDLHKEKHRKYVQKYRDNNREYWRSRHRIHQFNRRSKIEAVDDGTVTLEFMKELYAKEECFWCKKMILEKDRTAEHVKPLHLGGLHSASNLEMACLSCNSSKLNFPENSYDKSDNN